MSAGDFDARDYLDDLIDQADRDFVLGMIEGLEETLPPERVAYVRAQHGLANTTNPQLKPAPKARPEIDEHPIQSIESGHVIPGIAGKGDTLILRRICTHAGLPTQTRCAQDLIGRWLVYRVMIRGAMEWEPMSATRCGYKYVEGKGYDGDGVLDDSWFDRSSIHDVWEVVEVARQRGPMNADFRAALAKCGIEL